MALSGRAGIEDFRPQNGRHTFSRPVDDNAEACRLFNEYYKLDRGQHQLPVDYNTPILAQHVFNRQYFRIGSFRIQPDDFANYSAIRLVSDGFFKTLRKGEIQCFSCGYVHNIGEDQLDPFTGHRQHSNICQHLRGSGRDIPLRTNASTESMHSRSDENNIPPETEIARPEQSSQTQTVRSSRPSTSGRDSIRNIPRQNRNVGSSSVSLPVNARKRRNLQRRVALVDLRYELCRIQSFNHWPNNASADPIELANAGFFYMGTDDRVQCIFCRGILRCWEPDDKALAEHLRHFPQCPFLLDPQSVGNVQLGDEEESLFTNTVRRRSDESQEIPVADTMEGIVSGIPIHPDKVHISVRLASFRDFPSDTFQKSQDLAEAGFFYSGHLDTVHCYFCNLTVSNWKPSDDPWVIHVTKSDQCGFLLISRGQAFIDAIKRNGARRQTKPQNRRPRRPLKVQQEELNKFMSSRIVRAIQPDYDENTLRKVVTRRFQELGEGFPNTESLLDAIGEIVDDPDEESDVSEELAEEEGEHIGGMAIAKVEESMSQTGNANSNFEDMENLDEATLLRENQELVEETRCKVCLEERASIVFLRCGHLVCCSVCAPALTKCPICRQKILGTICVNL